MTSPHVMTSPYLRETYQPVPSVASVPRARPIPGPWSVTVAVVARDEERCIRRCVDSVLASEVDTVLVVDTGSTDDTLTILDSYRDDRLEIVRHRWDHSFAEARNVAMEHARPGWIVFLDADEWFTEETTTSLIACLRDFEAVPGIELAALAPRIRESGAGQEYGDIARIMPTWTLRFRGVVHEYPHVPASDVVPGLIGITLDVLHDGYHPEVALAKGKTARNLSALRHAFADEPYNPRWRFYSLRDGLWDMSGAEVVDCCTRLMEANRPGRGDRYGPEAYHRGGLAHACARLAQLGEWDQVLAYCADLDALSPPVSPDAVYYRGLHELLVGAGASPRGLLAAVRIRKDTLAVADSGLDTDGRPLDALIAAYLRDLKGKESANDYLTMCRPWTDPFFDASRLRR